MVKGIIKFIFLGVIAVVASGCDGGELEKPVPTPAPRVEAPGKPEKDAVAKEMREVPEVLQEKKESDSERYIPGDRRDPFLSILVTTEGGRSLENLPPLQRSNIEDLRVIGIIWGAKGYFAMIQTPDGKGYTIRRGTLIGPNRGKVNQITKRYISVEERYTDIFGERKTRVVDLELHPQEERNE